MSTKETQYHKFKMSDSDSEYSVHPDRSSRDEEIMWFYRVESKEYRAENKRLNAALQEQRLLAGMYQAELEAQRERAQKAESNFDRLLKAIYDVLYDKDLVCYQKIFRWFEGHTD